MQTRNLMAIGRAGLLAVFALAASACSIQQEVILGLEEGSTLTVDLPVLDAVQVPIEGGFGSELSINISFFRVLFGLPLTGTLTPTDLLIAGESFQLIPGIQISTICVFGDPNDPGSGTVELSLKDKEARFVATVNGVTTVVDPAIRDLFGDPLSLPIEVESAAPVSLIDLVSVLGGGTLPLSLTQEFNQVIESESPLLDGAVIAGTLQLASAETFPEGVLIAECQTLDLGDILGNP